MQDEMNELLKQIDSLYEELSHYDDVRPKINSILGRIRSTNNKIKKLKFDTMDDGQELRMLTPKKREIILSKKPTEKIDKKRMKKEGIYDKYLIRKSSIQSTIYDFVKK